MLPHLVCQTGGVAGAAGHGARQEEVPAALRGQRVVELGDLLVEQGGQRRRKKRRVAVEGEVGGLGVPVELVGGECRGRCGGRAPSGRTGCGGCAGSDMYSPSRPGGLV